VVQYLYDDGERGEQNGVVEMAQGCESIYLEELIVLKEERGVSTTSISTLQLQMREIFFAN